MLTQEIDSLTKADPDWKPRLSRSKAGKVLADKLLGIGGRTISDQRERNLVYYAAAGRLFDLPVQRWTLDPKQCHQNVASLWYNRTADSPLTAICRGYALASGGTWHPHSWALSVGIIETTPVDWTRYYGCHWVAPNADTVALWFLTRFAGYRFNGKRYVKPHEQTRSMPWEV
jgi:hypothetical protein